MLAARAGADPTAPKVGAGGEAQWHRRAVRTTWHPAGEMPGARRWRRSVSLCRRRRLAGALLRHVAVPGRRRQPQPLCHEPGRVLPAPLGSQLEERLHRTLPRLHAPASRWWVQGSQGSVGGPAGAFAERRHLPMAGEASPQPSPAMSLRGAAARHRGPSASCLTWAGSRYRTFDGRHFHFSGECTYSLAAAADGTWAVSIAAGNPRVLAAPTVGGFCG